MISLIFATAWSISSWLPCSWAILFAPGIVSVKTKKFVACQKDLKSNNTYKGQLGCNDITFDTLTDSVDPT